MEKITPAIATRVKVYINGRLMGLIQSMHIKFDIRSNDATIPVKIKRIAQKSIGKGPVRYHKINNGFGSDLILHKIENEEGFLAIYLLYSGKLKKFSK